MSTITIQPAASKQVRCPDGSLLPKEGATIALNAYWRRRISAGDVVCVQLEQPDIPAKANKKSHKE